MKLESFNICQQVADKHSLPYDLLKSINDIFFKTLKDTIRNPTEGKLIINAHPLGTFYYRRKKTMDKITFREDEIDEEYKNNLYTILTNYEQFDKDKLKFKYEKFGKESHDAYLMAKKEKNFSKSQKTHPEDNS